MISLRDLRVWTALIVIGLSAFVLRQASTVLSFGIAEALATPQSVEDRLQGFVAAPIVASLARRDLLRLAPAVDATTQVEDLSDFLMRRPLASGAWLDLSAARLAAHAGPDEVAQTLALSNLTGPNESYLMAGRATFGLPLWATLPPDSRRSVMSDLVGGWAGIDGAIRTRLKSVLSEAPGKTREEVRTALLLLGKPAIEIEKAMDLKPAPVPSAETPTPSTQTKPNSVVTPSSGVLSPSLSAPPSTLAPANQFFRGGTGR